MKKFLSFALVAAMLLSFAGCDKKAEVQPSQNPAETAVVSDAPTAAPSAEPSAEPAEDVLPALKDMFAEHGMLCGTCISGNMLKNKKPTNLALSQFSSITCENAMKPDAILNKEKSIAAGDLVVEFGPEAIAIMDWAKENGLKMRGHTIVWHSQTPDWIFYENFDNKAELVDRDTMLARLDSFVSQIFTKLDELGYIDMFYAYDVANECWEDDGSMRKSLWLQVIGEDYLVKAFEIADKYAPDYIDLYYNDYNEQFKTETFYNFLQTLKDADGNYLIDGVGFQAHLYTEDSLDDYFRHMDRIAELGLKIQLTELDVCLGHYQKPAKNDDEHQKIQGRFYYDLINGILERVDNGTVKSDALTIWGFSDGLSWRKEYNPLIFTMKYDPKYSFYGAMQIKDKAGFDE